MDQVSLPAEWPIHHTTIADPFPLLDGENYVDRVFITNVPGRPHIVIEDYDRRAAVEPPIGEAQREGVRIRMPDHTLRLARLKVLYVAAKIRFHKELQKKLN